MKTYNTELDSLEKGLEAGLQLIVDDLFAGAAKSSFQTLQMVYGLADTEAMVDGYDTAAIMQTMHKVNGGVRKLKDTTIELRQQVLGAFAQINWESIGVRGIYYRVVSIYGLPKTEATYKKIQSEVLAMRRDGSLDYKYIVDGSRHTYGLNTSDSVSDFLNDIAYSYRKDIWSGSEYRVEVTVEKDAMRDILMPICSEYGVNLSPTSGFNSETAWYSLAEKYKSYDRQPVLIMMTDHDTAGKQMVSSAQKAFDRFGVDVILLHAGLKEKHIAKYNLLTRPDKKDDTLNACELDAMTPDQAREVLTEAILPFADKEQFAEIRKQEQRERMTILSMAKDNLK